MRSGADFLSQTTVTGSRRFQYADLLTQSVVELVVACFEEFLCELGSLVGIEVLAGEDIQVRSTRLICEVSRNE